MWIYVKNRSLNELDKRETISTESWFKTYKSLQLLVGRVNDLYGSVLIPICLNFIISVCVLSLYIVIGTNCTIQVKAFCLLSTLMGLFNINLLLIQCVKMTDQSARAIRLKQEELNLRNVYVRSRFRTCLLLKTRVGPFHRIDRSTIVTAMMSILEYTISLLLIAFK